MFQTGEDTISTNGAFVVLSNLHKQTTYGQDCAAGRVYGGDK